MLFRIKAIHEIEAQYIVEAESYNAAVTKLCGSDPIAEYTQGTFGPDDEGLERQGIKVEDVWCNGPGPSGRIQVTRDWEVEHIDG